jgi:hypothetical protein
LSDAGPTWQRVKELVADALERPADERAGFLAALAGEPEPVRARVARLVAAAEGADDRLDGAVGPWASGGVGDWTGARVGGYRVQRFVARGGMGEVYEALQDGTGRRVALKVLARASSAAWRTRFRQEVGILARLSHPAIAQIVDADVHVDEHGREWPYFALEYVDGLPITAYAEARGLSVDARVRLTIEVCRGVQHAHQHGVIHRDLKPENVLVAEPTGGGPPQPKVLDFGVARVVGEDDAFVTSLTRAGDLIGTLAYMSPEQVAGAPDEVDTRSDVHALGVVLHQLLCGRLPFELAGLSLPDAVRRLSEEEPRPPSSYDPALRGDLDVVCATAMARDKEARYASVSELAADLERYLRREPLAAKPASRMYHLRLFARRHRGLVAGLAVAAVVLVLGAAGTAVGLVAARGEARRAGAEAERARGASLFLGEVLGSVDPEILGKDATLFDVLELHAPRIDAVFARDDRTRAELHGVVGSTWYGLGEYERALAHLDATVALRRALDGPDAPETLDAERRQRGAALELDSASDAALADTRELADRAARALGEEHEVALFARGDVSYVLSARGELEAALATLRGAYALARGTHGEDSEVALSLGSDLGNLLTKSGELDEATELLERLYAARAERYGRSHPATLRTLGNLATVDAYAERASQSLERFDRAIADARETWDADHPLLILLRANRGAALNGLGRYADAVDEYRAVHAARIGLFGPDHPQTLSALFNLGANLAYAERPEEALAATRDLMERAERCDGCDADFMMRASGLAAGVLADLDRFEEAAPLSELALAEHRRLLGPAHFQTLIQANNHARLLAQTGELGPALELFDALLASWTVEYPDVVAIERTFRWNYARALDDAGRTDMAARELERVNALEAEAGPNPRPERAEVLERLAAVYAAADRGEDAAACRAELGALRD